MISKFILYNIVISLFLHAELLCTNINSNPSPSKKLNILFYVTMFPKTTQWFIINQILGFLKHGHDITLLTQTKQDYHTEFNSLQTMNSMSHPEILKYNLAAKAFYKTLPKTQRNFDLVLCQSGTIAPQFLKYQKEANIQGKLITFLRGADVTKLTQHSSIRTLVFKKSSLFIPVCQYFKQQLIKKGCPAHKVVVSHSAIDCKRFPYKARSYTANTPIKIITVSRLIEKKGTEYAIKAVAQLLPKYPNLEFTIVEGTEYAIKAVAQLLPKYPNLEFTIVGGGPLESKLHSLIEKLHAENNIKLIGWRNQEEVAKLLAEAHIFVLPSITAPNSTDDQEGIPNALKEAMASGLPVISTYHSGIPELVKNGKNGFLVPERNVNALANKIEYLILNPTLWPILGQAGHDYVNTHFNVEHENEKLIRTCCQLLKKHTN